MHNNRLHADGNIADFDEAMELIAKIWNKVHTDCLFTEIAPMEDDPEIAALPHVVYQLFHRQHTPRLSDGRKPRQMSSEPDPDQPGQNLTEVIEWFDCIVDFKVFGNNKMQTREWTRNLENFLLTYAGYFKQQGISDILFQEELNAGVSTEYRQDLPHRYLRYSVRIQRTQVLRAIRLDDVDVEVSIPSPNRPNGSIPIFDSEFMDHYKNLSNVKEES